MDGRTQLKSESGIIRFNLSEPGGVLNGLTVIGAGDTPAAVVALTGRVKVRLPYHFAYT